MVCMTDSSTSSPIMSAKAQRSDRMIAAELHPLVDFRRTGIPFGEQKKLR
jgi:hypothetical protein